MQNLNWREVVKLATPYKKEILLGQLVALIAVIISLPIPLLFPYLIDEVLLNKPASLVHSIDTFFTIEKPYFYIIVVLVVTLFLRLFFFLLNLFQIKLFTTISKNIVHTIRKSLLEHLKKVSVSEYEVLGSGGVSAKMVTDINTIDAFLGVSIGKFIVSVMSLIGIAVVLLMIDPELGLIILLVNPLVIGLTVFLGKKVRELKRTENKKIEIFQNNLSEMLDLFVEIRTHNKETHYIGKILDDANEVKRSAIAHEWKSHGAQQLSGLVFFFGLEVLRALSMIMVLLSGLSIGDMVAVLGYIWFMFNPLQEVLLILFGYANSTAALERLDTLLTLKKEPQYTNTYNPFTKSVTNAITLKDISFSYDKNEVISHLDMHIQKGKTTAILGHSGSGKTTLAHIILGLYSPNSGTILIDDIDSKEIGLGIIRQNIALVLQQPKMFNDTLRQNLTLGESFCEDELWHILQEVQLGHIIENLSEGLDTQIGKDGIRLSGGERQRLSLARMLLRKPNVIIMDESTSALDVHTEANLFASLNQILAGKTVVIIAHRLSTVKHADYIYMMDKGAIVEEGDPEALLGEEGRYSAFVNRNLEG
jgi:ATP-binding cassette, subfamily C, bacterial